MLQRTGLIWLALALVTLGAYFGTLRNDFVNYDDPDYVTSNPHVQAGLTGETIGWAFTTGHASNWHPLTWLSHALDCQLFGLNPVGPHLINLLWHIANTLLVFGVFRRLTGALWPSAFVAAVFAWHPLHVESVAWVSERKDVLSTFFWLLTMLAYTAYARAVREKDGRPGMYYVLALLCFSLGLMAKPMLVTLPFVLLLLDYWPLCRTPNIGIKATPKKKTVANVGASVPVKRLLLEKVPFVALAAISSIVTFIVQRKGGAVSSLDTLAVSARLANALVSYLRYVGKLFLPVNLSVLYPHPGYWPWWLVVIAGFFLLGVSFFVLLGWRKRPYLLVGWFWFLGTLIPVIGLVQVGVQSMADRYTYVPLLGLFMMLAWGVPDLLAGWPGRNRALAFGSGVALALCVLGTRAQVPYWATSERLFRRAVAVTKDNYLAYNNLGFFLDHDGKVDEAMVCYQKSLEINPNYEEAQNNIGFLLAGKGQFAQAIPYYEAALRIRPTLVEAHNNYGNALSDLGRLDEAIAQYQTALRLQPDHADAHGNYGIALAMQGKLDDAIQQLKESVRLKPKNASAHSNLGNALALQHNLDEAVAHYRIALELKAADPQAHNNLANVLAEQGKLDEAAAHYGQAIQLKADNPEAHFNLAMVLRRQSKNPDALQHFREALRLKPDYAAAQQQIALLMAGKP